MDRLANQGFGEMMMEVCVDGIHDGEQYTNADAIWQYGNQSPTLWKIHGWKSQQAHPIGALLDAPVVLYARIIHPALSHIGGKDAKTNGEISQKSDLQKAALRAMRQNTKSDQNRMLRSVDLRRRRYLRVILLCPQ
jgi:hypothetical protein